MSKIQDKLKQIEDEKAQLLRDQRKVQFLNHILDSTRGYADADFKDVKDDVVTLMEAFVKRASEAIEARVDLEYGSVQKQPEVDKASAPKAEETKKPAPAAPHEMSPNEKMSFALDNRHLGGKRVQIKSGENVTNGEVVGIDAPYIHVKTDAGPVVKATLQQVSMI